MTRFTPVVPPAPPTFSIITGWPMISCMRAVTMRPTESKAPPAAKGTTTVTAREGYSCARASNVQTAATTARALMKSRALMAPSYCVLVGCTLADAPRGRLIF